jgi:RNA polymerase sigma-70 factor (ECF subfamily)
MSRICFLLFSHGSGGLGAAVSPDAKKNETWTGVASLATMRIVSTLSPDAFRLGMNEGGADDGAVERALVDRARAGDEKAFRLIFDRHAGSVRRFLQDLLRDREAADEGTQEVFVRAHGRLHSLRDDHKLGPWLFGIARHVFHETLRSRRAKLTPVPPEAEVDQRPTPEGALMGREADEKLAEALAHLPEERRAALLLRIDHGLDYEEIRGVMGWSMAKVKNEIHRARLELRSRLHEYVGGRVE